MKGTAARQLVADLVQDALPSSWTVYAEPTATPASPSAVVAPRRPFRTLTTGCVESVGLAVTLLMNVAQEDVWTVMDDLVEAVRDELRKDPTIVMESVDDMGTVLNVSGIDHLTASLAVSVFVK